MPELSPDTLAAMRAITLSTGELPGTPLDVVFAPVVVGHLDKESLHDAFDRAKDSLRLAALALGANAVGNCRFDHTLHGQTGSSYKEEWGSTSIFTVTAYGTALRR